MLYMFFADGFEEVEAIAALDVIRRAGIPCVSVGVGANTVTGSHNITLKCDISENEIDYLNMEGVILPGGMPGTENLYASDSVINSIDFCCENNKLLCAICAAPIILGRKKILTGKKAVCYPGFENELYGASVSEEYVVSDGNIITAKGMGSAIKFGLEIVKFFKGKDFSDKLYSTLQCS